MELYRWLGDAIKPALSELKPVQLKDLETSFSTIKVGEAQPTRELSSQKKLKESVADDNDVGADDGEQQTQELTAYDLAEPVDITNKIPFDLSEALASAKWLERKAGLDNLYIAINVPRIKNENYIDLVNSLARCVSKDANVAVVTIAAQCITVLATGLRGGFSKYRSTVTQPLLERLKEKKPSVVESLRTALDAVFSACGLSEVLEDTLKFLEHKNPQVKAESVHFLVRCLTKTKTFPQPTEVKSIAEANVKLLADTNEPVRAASAEALGTLMKIVGERALAPYLDKVDDLRKAKIKDSFEQATVVAKPEKPKPIQATKSEKKAPPRQVVCYLFFICIMYFFKFIDILAIQKRGPRIVCCKSKCSLS